jgi:O-antigen ligase/tetratricopeptide (TPR) repeat protein
MLEKIMNYLTYIFSGLFLLDTGSMLLSIFSQSVVGYRAGSFFEYLGYASPVINTILLVCIGWTLTKSLYKGKVAELSPEIESARRLGLAMLFAVPFIAIIFSPSFLYPYIVGKALVFRFLALGVFLTYLYIAFREKTFWPRLTPAVIGISIFTAAMGLSFIFSMDSYRSFWGNYERMEGFVSVISVFMMFIALVSLRLREFEWRKLFVVHFAVSMFVAFISILQYVALQLAIVFNSAKLAGLPIIGTCINTAPNCRVDATFGNPIYLGIYAALSAWIIAYVAFKNKGNSGLLWFGVVANLVVVYLSGTRGTMVGLLAGAFVAAVLYFAMKGMKRELGILVASSVVAVAIFAGIVMYTKKTGVCQNIPVVSKFCSANTLIARKNVWKVALTTFQQHPVFGIGQENFIHSFNANYNPAMYKEETYFDHPHNTYLGWLSMGGLLGFVGYLIFILSVVWAVFKTYTKENSDVIVIATAVGAFVTYFVHIFFVFDNLTSILLFIFMAAYFGRNFSMGSVVVPTISNQSKKMLLGGLSVVFLVAIYFSWWKPAYANMLTIKAMSTTNADAATMIEQTSANFQKVISMNTFGTYEVRELYLNKAYEYKSVESQVKDEKIKAAIGGMVKNAVDNFNVQVTEKPFDHRSRFMLGLYQTNTGDVDGAIKTLEDAVKLAPNKQVALLSLARVYLAKGRTDEALAVFKRAVDVTPKENSGYNELRIQYIQALMIAGKDAETVEIIKDLLPVSTVSDFQTLVYQMAQVFGLRQDLKGMVGVLNDAISLNPTNDNFYIWLAQAYASAGKYQESAQIISRLQAKNPQVYAQFINQLQAAVDGTNKQTQQQAAPAQTEEATTTKK